MEGSEGSWSFDIPRILQASHKDCDDFVSQFGFCKAVNSRRRGWNYFGYFWSMIGGNQEVQGIKNSSQKQLTQFGKSGAMGFPKVRKHPIYQPMGGEILYLTAFFFAVFFSCRSTITPGWNLGLVQDVHPTGLDSNCCGCTLAHQWAWNVRVYDPNPPKNSVFPLSC